MKPEELLNEHDNSTARDKWRHDSCVSGRIRIGEGSVALREKVREQVALGKQQILINLANVSYVDSSGLGELISAFTTAKNRGVILKLLNLTKRLHELMQITKLYTGFRRV